MIILDPSLLDPSLPRDVPQIEFSRWNKAVNILIEEPNLNIYYVYKHPVGWTWRLKRTTVEINKLDIPTCVIRDGNDMFIQQYCFNDHIIYEQLANFDYVSPAPSPVKFNSPEFDLWRIEEPVSHFMERITDFKPISLDNEENL